jgi:putative ABC transport system ATP-binding protein
MEDRRTPLQYRLVAPMIHLSGIYKSYQTPAGAIPALLGIDLKVFPGEFLVLIGKSGAGKSTLVNVLTGIDLPDHGEILVEGAAVHLMDEDQRARWRGRNMGVVFQFFQLMPSISLLRNITMPMEFCGFLTPAERKHRSLELLEQVGIGDHANKKPAHISGGQQQRAAIARALANDPPIIIADEPTGNLDSKTAKEILDLFMSLIDQGKTILIVTHDKSVAKYASRIIEIKDGMIN